MKHIFAICAYGKSEYLERCIKSLKGQSVEPEIILCTSTPNAHIDSLAKQYHIPLYIRQGKSNIRDDWNYAYAMANGEYVTIAHQDDVYHRDYLKYIKQAVDKHSDTLIAMTDYKIINSNNQVRGDFSLLIKKLLKLPLRFSGLSTSNLIKRRVQSLGNAICCPSVCYHKTLLGENIFKSEYEYVLDWEAFYKIAGKEGRFTYIPRPLFYYRIHEGATSVKCLKNHKKEQEEYEMFLKFWPRWLVRIIMRGYRISYNSYEK